MLFTPILKLIYGYIWIIHKNNILVTISEGRGKIIGEYDNEIMNYVIEHENLQFFHVTRQIVAKLL